jgi:thiol-disulfide isomerase/thioredoxin
VPALGVPVELHQTADFDRLIAKSSLPVVVDYWAPWCGPCRMVAPELQKVATRQAGRMIVVKVKHRRAVRPRAAVQHPIDPHARRFRERSRAREELGRTAGQRDRGVGPGNRR